MSLREQLHAYIARLEHRLRWSTWLRGLAIFTGSALVATLVLVTIAIALVMSPAALHRQTEPLSVSRPFISMSSRLLMASLVPLAVGICLDIYLVTRVTVGTRGVAATVAVFLLGVFIVLWLLLPRLARARSFAASAD